MSETPPPLTETAPEPIANAYNAFKGGGDVSIPKANEMLDNVHTARITGYRRDDRRIVDAVDVHLKDVTDVPDVVAAAADRHGLVEADREYEYDSDTLRTVTYVQADDLPGTT